MKYGTLGKRSFLTGLALLWTAMVQPLPAHAQGSAPRPTQTTWITLGTQGGPVPNPDRSQPANVLITADGPIVVDAGDGVSSRLAGAGVSLASVRTIFLSHLHFDHTAGLAGLLGLRYAISAPGSLKIYGPPGTRALVAGLVASMRPASEAGYGLPGQKSPEPATGVEVIEMVGGSSVAIGGLTARAVENSHYSFDPDSPEAKRFKSLSFRFEAGRRSFVYTGDTGESDALVDLARGADLLVSEVMDLDATVAEIKRTTPLLPPAALLGVTEHLRLHHLTPEQVGALARRAAVKRVVLTHQLPGATSPAAQKAMLQGVARLYSGPVVLASDMDRF